MRAPLPAAVATWGRRSLDLLFPPRCADCDADLAPGAGDLLLCERCCRALEPGPWYPCRHCGGSLARPDGPCEQCLRRSHPPLWFDRVVTLGPYRDALRDAVLKMKRRAGDPLSAAVARLFVRRRGDELAEWEPDFVVPVPMHWARRLARGTNSPEILARHLARHLRIPVAVRMLRRRRNTLPQADLPPGRRFSNVLGAFGLGAPYDLRGAQVLLVDDVLTTSATCSEAAKVLKQAGTTTVVAAVVARAEGPRSR